MDGCCHMLVQGLIDRLCRSETSSSPTGAMIVTARRVGAAPADALAWSEGMIGSSRLAAWFTTCLHSRSRRGLVCPPPSRHGPRRSGHRHAPHRPRQGRRDPALAPPAPAAAAGASPVTAPLALGEAHPGRADGQAYAPDGRRALGWTRCSSSSSRRPCSSGIGSWSAASGRCGDGRPVATRPSRPRSRRSSYG